MTDTSVTTAITAVAHDMILAALHDGLDALDYEDYPDIGSKDFDAAWELARTVARVLGGMLSMPFNDARQLLMSLVVDGEATP